MTGIGPRLDRVRDQLDSIGRELSRCRATRTKAWARAIERHIDAAQRELDVASDYGHGLDRRRPTPRSANARRRR